MLNRINTQVLMSGAGYFSNSAAINPFMNAHESINREQAQKEHDHIREALHAAGIEVIKVAPPKDCQDGVYTANWALVRGNKAAIAKLPNARKNEESYAEQILRDLGKEIIHIPVERFSGQGDALPCGNLLFMGTHYRTDPTAHEIIREALGYDVISLQTIPKKTWYGRSVTNKSSGWPDSFFYDIDLALSIIRPVTDTQKGLIAWCPAAFTKASQQTIRALDTIDKIEVSLHEAKDAFACNLVSTGETVIMSAHAPQLKADLKAHGLKIITPEISELAKGGGYIRCTTLTLNNA